MTVIQSSIESATFK